MLTVVPTPIGHLGDITLRALEVLRTCDVIAAEDTRHTGILLKHYSISKPQVSLHEHNEAARSKEIVRHLQEGRAVALVTDAGMPGISDPGMRLIRVVRKAGIPVTVLPGPCSAITAIVGSGMETGSFFFGGFLPNKSGRRCRELSAALDRPGTSIFFESPHRLLKTLTELKDLDPGRRVCVARELTKRFEEYHSGTVSEVLDHFSMHPPRGEICLVIAGASGTKRVWVCDSEGVAP